MKRITNKLSNPGLALAILFKTGFIVKNVNDKQRLVWVNTEENMEQLVNIHSILSKDPDQIRKLFDE